MEAFLLSRALLLRDCEIGQVEACLEGEVFAWIVLVSDCLRDLGRLLGLRLLASLFGWLLRQLVCYRLGGLRQDQLWLRDEDGRALLALVRVLAGIVLLHCDRGCSLFLSLASYGSRRRR